MTALVSIPRTDSLSRFSRIFPAYWAAIIISFAVLSWIKSPPHASLIQFAVNFTMLERVFGLQHIDTVYWTLTGISGVRR